MLPRGPLKFEISLIFDGPKFSQIFRIGCNRYFDGFGSISKVSDDAGDGHDDADDGHDDVHDGHDEHDDDDDYGDYDCFSRF